MKKTKVKKETEEFSAAVGRALRRAAKVARKTARMHGTPIYIGRTAKSSQKNHNRISSRALEQIRISEGAVMAHHKRKRSKNQRAGCLMCKPWKMNGFGQGRPGPNPFQITVVAGVLIAS